MEQPSPATSYYRRLYWTTVWFCVANMIATLAAAGLELHFARVKEPELVGLGFLAASSFGVVWALAFFGRDRLLPAAAALLAAITGAVVSFLLFGSYCHELVEVIVTGESSYRGAGNLRGLEFLLVAFVEWAFGMPGFLVLFALGWMISPVKKAY